MALLFCDSFDHYTTVTQKWTNASTVVSPTISSGGGKNSTNALTNSYSASGNAFMQVRKTLGSAYTTLVAGVAYKTTRLADDNNWGRTHFSFAKDNAMQIGVTIDASGRVQVRRGNWKGTVIEQTSADVIAINTWYYLEFKVYIHDTAGTYEVKLDGTTILSGTSVDTKGAAASDANQLWLGEFANQSYGYWEDLYLCDTSGTFADDFLGEVRVEAILPDGAGNYSQWTPTSGLSNYQCVDEVSPNGDTDYVLASDASKYDTYSFDDLETTLGEVQGVMYSVYGKKVAGGVEQFKPVYRPVSTDYEGTTTALADSYAYYHFLQNLNPQTSAQWTITNLNASEFGIKSET